MATIPIFDPATWLDQFKRVGGIIIHYSSGGVAAGYLVHRNPVESQRAARRMLDAITDEQEAAISQHLAATEAVEG